VRSSETKQRGYDGSNRKAEIAPFGMPQDLKMKRHSKTCELCGQKHKKLQSYRAAADIRDVETE
jgi:hypothetical protein